MTQLSNENIYQTLSKEELINLVKLYGRLALSLDGFWFLGVENLQGIIKAIELDTSIWGQYGKNEAKLLKRFLGINTVTTLEEICKIYLLTPIFGNLGAKAEIRDGKCLLSITDCHPQKARIRKGFGEFPCKEVGMAYFAGLFSELNPKIRFQCEFCPPDEHTEELWCQWQVWLDQD